MSRVTVEAGDVDPKLILAIAAALTKDDYDVLDGMLALSIDEAARVCSTSRTNIEVAIRNGDLRGAYRTSRPMIPVRYLKDWLFASPDIKP